MYFNQKREKVHFFDAAAKLAKKNLLFKMPSCLGVFYVAQSYF